MALRLIIADDHPLLVDGLRRVLEEIAGAEVVACAENGLQLINILRQLAADVVLLDLQMPKLDGIDALKVLQKEFPKLKIIIFTNYDQPKLIREITMLGAKGYLLKNSTSMVIKEAVTTVASGGTWFRESAAAEAAPPLFTNDFLKKYQLTNREIEIIQKIAKGLTTKEIATQLFVSEFTINSHRRNICRKLNIYTPVGLINFARNHGLV
jgi:DNA-binding NarL/FixJ family response regulator